MTDISPLTSSTTPARRSSAPSRALMIGGGIAVGALLCNIVGMTLAVVAAIVLATLIAFKVL